MKMCTSHRIASLPALSTMMVAVLASAIGFFPTLASAAEEAGGCADPLAAIMETLECVAKEDVQCASAGYNSEKFVKLHNTKDTNTSIDSGGQYWKGAFDMVDFTFSYDKMMNIGPNKAAIRYIEGVTFTDGSAYGYEPSKEYPWSFAFKQHEYALVTVDDDCKITMWDQYGDDAEQNYHYDGSDAVFQILCDRGTYPPEVCAMFGVTPSPSPNENSGLTSIIATFITKVKSFFSMINIFKIFKK